jgi:hypothetical protein
MAIIVKDEYIQIDRLELGPFGTNSYILICQETNESVVVDAPGKAGMVVERLKKTEPTLQMPTICPSNPICSSMMGMRFLSELTNYGCYTRRDTPPAVYVF